MKAVLLVLSGDPEKAHDWLRQNVAEPVVEPVSRYELERAGAAERLRIVRRLKPDVFAIMTERMQWERGQNALFAFGALAGARRVVMIDSRGAVRQESRGQIIARTPSRMAGESVMSIAAVKRSRSRLRELERKVAARTSQKIKSTLGEISLAYLRSTPSPGSHAGGAATHINGFINAATGLGARVRIITNDYIAGLDERRMTLIDPEPIGTTRAAFDLRNN